MIRLLILLRDGHSPMHETSPRKIAVPLESQPVRNQLTRRQIRGRWHERAIAWSAEAEQEGAGGTVGPQRACVSHWTEA